MAAAFLAKFMQFSNSLPPGKTKDACNKDIAELIQILHEADAEKEQLQFEIMKLRKQLAQATRKNRETQKRVEMEKLQKQLDFFKKGPRMQLMDL